MYIRVFCFLMHCLSSSPNLVAVNISVVRNNDTPALYFAVSYHIQHACAVGFPPVFESVESVLCAERLVTFGRT